MGTVYKILFDLYESLQEFNSLVGSFKNISQFLVRSMYSHILQGNYDTYKLLKDNKSR